jgi:D-serine deaminase-like pyridoxal phosphate-dependent protein
MLVEHGYDDLLIAYQLISQSKMQQLAQLLPDSNIVIGCDSLQGANELQSLAEQLGQQIKVSLEVDSGLHRCGTAPGAATLSLANSIRSTCPDIIIVGLFTHAGQAYAAKNLDEIRKIAIVEASSVVDTAELLRSHGYAISEVSVGSTPTARYAHQVPGVTEIRPGNYVFYDAIQVGLGVARAEQCALTVQTTVISRPTDDRAVVDAGSKVLGLDKGAHGIELVKGFGIVVGWPHLVLERLSEEHGIITRQGDGAMPSIGEQLQIIPNHACPVLYRADLVHVTGVSQQPVIWHSQLRGSR